MALTQLSNSPAAEQPTGPIALAGAPRPAGAPKPKPRKRVNTAEKRHQHNAIERQRRETLNGKFLVLARLLPSLAACRRPSKSAIVNGSISHLSHQRNQRLLASKLIRQLAAERDELFKEVNEWRQANGFQPKHGAPAAWNDEMEEVCQVEKETFGNFATVGGDGGDDQQEDEDELMNPGGDNNHLAEAMDLQRAALVAGSLGSGLLTPRSSTDISSGMPNQSLFGGVSVKTEPVNWTSNYSLPASAVPSFNAFMTSDSVDASSTGSPVGSHHSAILTPPSIENANVYTHTPSPRSSGSAEEPSTAPAHGTPAATRAGPHRQNSMPAHWSPQQLAFLQQQVHQQSLHRQQQQHAALAALAAQQPQADMNNIFLGASSQASSPTANQQNGLAQLMATMFPQQRESGVNSEQIEHWRKLAFGGMPAQQPQQQQQLNLNFNWNDQAVGAV
ncbi:uncharacterized protein LOC62_03G004008 [Vanrija pseudolonga]|uniref:BHLH domain-containing protein n=1 Tax=Vanrija pseudolonga TaxID=143232 RepID=A0AAF0Y5J6_9TREE|nr:hypothetical protein LOC62_03G004008 [Vanrija pseudolonga]